MAFPSPRRPASGSPSTSSAGMLDRSDHIALVVIEAFSILVVIIGFLGLSQQVYRLATDSQNPVLIQDSARSLAPAGNPGSEVETTKGWSLSMVPLSAALMVALLTMVFTIDSRLQRDSEGLV